MSQLNSEHKEIVDHLEYLKIERESMRVENQLNYKFIQHANGAIDYWTTELNLLKLLHFCRTGKYPDET